MSHASYRAKLLLKRRPKKESVVFKLEDYLFKEQLDFIRDPAKFAVACCSVRAGKSVACAADLVYTALNNPGTVGLYITLARSSGKKILLPELRAIKKKYKIKAKINLAELSMTFLNGSVIY